VAREDKPGTTLLTLTQSGDTLTGKWIPAKGATSEIENAKIAGDILTFSFIHDKTHFNATFHLSGDSMPFDVVELKKHGKTKDIHGKATRKSMS